MACSKFFSGNLPELLNEVIQYFHYDYKTLHSCILVNRLWCRLAIPLLWEDPFSIRFPKNYRFIEIYLCNLSDDDKTRLNKYVIHSGLFPSNTLFNYPKFIQHLDTYKVSDSIKTWASTNLPTSHIVNFITELININVLLSELFNQLNVLESIHIVYYESLEPLIQRSGNCLENFNINNYKSQQLLQSLKLYCRNIKFLSIELHYQNVDLIFNLIKNIRQNLNYLIINSDGKIKFSLILLHNLGQILPFKLEYLRLVLAIKGSDLENEGTSQDILPYIKEYIVKKKRVKYLAILDVFCGKKVDLFSLKDEVKEFQLYDIQVLDYYDSIINIYDFINNSYWLAGVKYRGVTRYFIHHNQ
ncbi:hypothetical protein GLOIN_2v1879328 [Rhizophagus irregularis DAOM 181602=DAOM 197198]|nr:hypothetical protein GLOIN_2v1879328 [Rhizophagus irregularis DAOM 181602=DAOM 197198]